jgi:hypothetical protein
VPDRASMFYPFLALPDALFELIRDVRLRDGRRRSTIVRGHMSAQ